MLIIHTISIINFFVAETSTRVMAQLYTRNPSDMAEKTGLGRDIFDTDLWIENSRNNERKNKTLEVS